MDFKLEAGDTPLDPNEIEGLIPSLRTQADLNRVELQNILRAVRWAEESKTIKESLLTDNSLRQLHQKMFDRVWKWAGKYRKTQKSIGIEANRIPTEMRNLMEDVKIWIESESYPTEEILVRFHHRLVQIHAFPNGNGRHARLATDLLADQLGVPRFSWGANSRLDPGTLRQSYIKALQMADQHDFDALLLFVRS